MTPEERRAFGKQVARLRSQRGLTQAELAAAIGRTASWMSQVERGIQPVVRLDVLQLLADGLGVSVHVLQPTAPTEPPAPPPAVEQANDLDAARLLISGHPALGVLLGDSTEEEPPSLDALKSEVDEVWKFTHAAQFAELSAALEVLVPRLERASRRARGKDRAAVSELLGRMYQALAAAFVRQDEADAAWVAADRAIRAAEQSEQPFAVCAGIFRLAHAFLRAKRLDQAEHAAATAVATLQAHITDGEASQEALSVLGALHLVLGQVHARAGRRAEARSEIANARSIGERLGEDRNDFNLEFGPTNVELWAIAIALDLGDAGEALDIGHSLDVSGLSAERRSRFLTDMGRAHTQRRHIGEATDCLLRAEELAPESVRTHIAVRECIRELVLIAGRSAPAELLELAERADALS
ncbi:helix-turn-helix domain-containing protein [Streptomyces populi]